MGTTWSVRFDNPRMLALDLVRTAIESALARVITQMSHWEEDSDLSRYGRARAGSRHTLAPEFASVLACALHWAQASGGALDPTVGPLVALWGFGPHASADAHLPPPDTLRATHARCGWQHLLLDAKAGTLMQPGGLTLDLSGIAKGFAVDHVAEGLRWLGLEDFLVEIGGELRGVGHRPGGAPWTVRIASPDDTDKFPRTRTLEDMAIATSGDRWHWREDAGRRWSHTIDPRTGQPVDHPLAAVTVLHAECMQADALATVLTVLGPTEGIAFADANDVAALFFERSEEGLRTRASRAWQ
jgi:FAD:protein FMN transferase